MDQSENLEVEATVERVGGMEAANSGLETYEMICDRGMSLLLENNNAPIRLGNEDLVIKKLDLSVGPTFGQLGSTDVLVAVGPSLDSIFGPLLNKDVLNEPGSAREASLGLVWAKRKAKLDELEEHIVKKARVESTQMSNKYEPGQRIILKAAAKGGEKGASIKKLVHSKDEKCKGGLALFWKLGVELEIIFTNQNVMVALVYSDPPENVWLLIAVHGPPYLAKRRKFWELMEEIIGGFSGHWLLLGDLNSISFRLEKMGGSQKGERSLRSLRNFVNNVGAIDLGFNGPKFTWSNRRIGWANIRERLDRGICNVEWQNLFPNAGVRHLTTPNSDHNPILLDTHLDMGKGVRPFRFEAMWAKEESSVAVVEKAWDYSIEGSQNFILDRKCQRVKHEFIHWNKHVFGNTKARIKALEDKIKEIQDLDPCQENIEMEAALNVELNEWLEWEELKWKQKSKELWLRKGDRNSKFFHLSTVVRRRRNLISEIQLSDGQWIHSRDDIESYFSMQFQNIFQTSNPHIPPQLEGLFTPCITELENTNLSRVPELSEIKEVVWDMHPMKAPGPDGLPGLFFKKYWSTVGEQVLATIQSFFREVLKALGFDQKATNLIYQCISTVSFTLLLNGGKSASFSLTRGVKLALGAPSISSFFYADDVLLFCGAKIGEVEALMHCIDKYCGWSANKFKELAFVKDKLEARVCGWKSKCLSWMGRATLIKTVAQASPIYGMSAFKFPKGLFEDLNAIVRKFWWNPKKEGNRFYTPVAWSNLCRPLSDGGLDFRPFESFNEAMIAKLAWWVQSNRDSLCVKVLRAKYKVGSNWLQARPAGAASFSWRGLEGVRYILAKGACHLVGSGDNILVWRDPWIPNLLDYLPQPRDNVELQCLAVAQLMNHDKLGWDENKLKDLFNEETVLAIKNIPRWSREQEDKWVWLKTTSGEFSVKSAYKEICQPAPSFHCSPVFAKIWKSTLHDRLKMHLWRIASNLLPTKASLVRFDSNMDSSCSLCDHHLETSIHLFWECSLARAVWFGSEWSIQSEGILLQNPLSLIEMLVDPPATLGFNGAVKEKFLLMGALILDQLWKLRNAKVHDGRSVKMNHISRELSVRGREHWDIRRIPQSSSIPHPSTGWCFPNHGVIKFNCNAAVGGSFSCIAVVARNWRGEVVLALSRRVNTTIPLQAEAEALLWATHLAAELFYGFGDFLE
uniref:Reverse transcriptase zinc-binding domain-containing protein n=1 Tax=Fagus sylvatica TaxID=28930 RepID=A0A2N9GPX3_FAGSY